MARNLVQSAGAGIADWTARNDPTIFRRQLAGSPPVMDDLTNKLKNRFGLGGSAGSSHWGHTNQWQQQPQQPYYPQPHPPPNQTYQQGPNYSNPPYHPPSSSSGPPPPTGYSNYGHSQDGFVHVSGAPSPIPPQRGGYYAPQPIQLSDRNTWEDVSYPASSTSGPSAHDTPPPIPPKLKSDTRPERLSPIPPTPSSPQPGAIYAPGTYPTPDLFPFPLSKHKVLTDAASQTSAAIQHALDELGPHSTLYLPPRTRWSVSSTIWMKPHQELATLGYPTEEHEIAWLEAEEGCTGHILSGADQPGARLRNIGVDGGREKYGYNKANDCIVQFGNSKGFNQVVDRCIIRHPRQWSCLQVFQGAEGVRVTNNLIGPAGFGDDAEEGGHWADGISYAAQNGLVAGNRILDATDGGIVIFGAPGTLVTSNTIITSTRLGLGAINMVDYGPHDGNYLGTRVIHNTIRVDGSYLKIGIGQGSSVWFNPRDKPRDYIRGATVKYNLITGNGSVGYGFPVSDVDDWICTDNTAASSIKFEGDMSRMSRDPRNLSIGPGPFVRSPEREGQGQRNSTLQPEFVVGPISDLIAIQPGTSSYRVFWPGQLSLSKGQSVALLHIELLFDTSGEVLLRETAGHQRVLWSAGTAPFVGGALDPKLALERRSGKLTIVDGDTRLFDLTPQINSFEPNDIALALSDTRPYLTLASSTTGSVFFAPTGYQAPYQWEIRQGTVICQSTPDGQFTLASMLNSFGQYVVVQTVHGPEVRGPLPPKWPLDPNEWRVIWESHRSNEEDPQSRMIFQGDGNLVIYSGKDGHALWASGSCGKQPPVTSVRWGRGTQDDPLLSCATDDGAFGWSSFGKIVG